MYIESPVIIYKKYFLNKKIIDRKDAKINDVSGLSPNHVLSSNNGKKDYINTNLEIL